MVARYEILEGPAIKCLTCGLTSHHPEDVRHKFCGKCGVFHEDEELKAKVRSHCHTCHNHERTSCGNPDCPCFSGECDEQ